MCLGGAVSKQAEISGGHDAGQPRPAAVPCRTISSFFYTCLLRDQSAPTEKGVLVPRRRNGGGLVKTDFNIWTALRDHEILGFSPNQQTRNHYSMSFKKKIEHG